MNDDENHGRPEPPGPTLDDQPDPEDVRQAGTVFALAAGTMAGSLIAIAVIDAAKAAVKGWKKPGVAI